MNTIRNLGRVRKAVLAFVLPTLGAAGALMGDGNFTAPEAVMSLGVGLTTGYTVYRVPNTN